MGKNLYYRELDSEQIFYEIVKRFSSKPYDDDELSIYDIFGEEWKLLNRKARLKAMRMFQDAITDKSIKGIRYIDKGEGPYFYMRIRNDVYQE